MSIFGLLMRPRFVVACAIAASTLAIFLPAAAQERLRVATEGAYAPWNYKDASGALIGWDIDITNALCAKMKVQCEIVAQEWDGIIPGLLVKKYDMIIAGMSMTPKRREQVEFTKKYKDVVSRFVAKKGSITDTSPAGMKGKRIGVQRGASQRTWLESSGYDKTATLVFYDSVQGPELDLVAGRIDAMVGNEVSYYIGFLKRPEAKDFDFVGPQLTGGVLGDGAGIAIRKDDPALRDRLNKAIDEIVADGSYDTITKKYFPFKVML